MGCFIMKVCQGRCGHVHSCTREALPACSVRVSCTCTVRPFPANSGKSSLQLSVMLQLPVLGAVPSQLVLGQKGTMVSLPLLLLPLLALTMSGCRWQKSEMTMLTTWGSNSYIANINSG